MIDDAFYERRETKAEALAAAAGLSTGGLRDVSASSVASAELAGPEDLTFVEKKTQIIGDDALSLNAAICFVPTGASAEYTGSCVLIEADHPRAAFAVAAPLIVSQRFGWAQTEPVHASAQIESEVEIGPNVSIGPCVKIGRGTTIEPGAVIAGGVTIGRNCRIGANTTISHSHIGDNVVILANSVVGQPGFGLAPTRSGLIDTPHFGRVIIQDNVSIGACVTVDRGLFDDTVLGLGSKIDNLSQIAHNVEIGAHSVMAAFAGIAGSAKIGSGVMMGGRVGVADHTKVGDGARLAAGAATMKDVPNGETWCGVPARPIKQFFREVAWVTKAAAGKSKS